jgi:uncharacterized protein (DUF1810 family)
VLPEYHFIKILSAMKEIGGLQRFVEAQRSTYDMALNEIRHGKKQSHWMWFIFPQLQGLANSEMSVFYAIKNMEEARDYLDHEILGARLIEISNELLKLDSSDASAVFGYPDDRKLLSCMTLFAEAAGGSSVFQKLLEKYFLGNKDSKTLVLLGAGH